VAVPELRALLADHQAMWGSLLAAAPKTRAEVLAVVERYFPGNAWESRLGLARQQANEAQHEVTMLVAAGKVFW